ncbi:MFS transporter [Kyrpidia spormannii]|uniref:Tartrate transporter n=1 Tax=Kyrpidia spormannii TaxID=2055160 RepID=A0ACA8ZCQ0_9BACL|nr:MFS transporter [Kyrpidia spormannii]CAB3394311.1 Putative tartrate transporter [Kyrpidia spormannii]
MSDVLTADNARTRKYLHIILPLFIGSVLAFLDRLNLAYAALTMNKDLGFSAEVYGMGAGILFLGYILFEVPGTLIAEKWSPRKWVARIMISWGLACALMAFIHTDVQFYIVRFLIGAAEASFYPVCYAVIIPRWFSAKERPTAVSIMLTSLLVSNIIGSPLAGLLLDVSWLGFKGWQMLFLLEGGMALIFGIIVSFWLADWPKDVKWLSEDEKRVLAEQYEREVAAKSAVRSYTVWEALRDKEVLKLCFIYFMWITGFWGFGFWMPTVLKSVSGWSNASIGWLIVIPMAVALIGFIVTGNSSALTGEKRWHVAIPMFIGAVGMGLGPFVANPLLSFILVCVSAVGVYVGMGVWWTYPTSFLSGAAAAGAVGLINSVGNLGGWVGPYLVGFVKDRTGSFTGAYLYLAFSLLVAGLLILTLRKKLPVDHPASVQQSELN